VGVPARFIHFHGVRHPDLMGAPEVNAFLTHLAVGEGVAASTQNQAASALLFLYRNVLERDMEAPRDIIGARPGKRVPTVLGREDVHRLLGTLEGPSYLVASLLYGSGLRLMEALTLRVKDLDLALLELRVRRGKGGQDRITMIPGSLRGGLERQLKRVCRLHQRDRQRGAGWVELPAALARKSPAPARELAWQWLFPATRLYRHEGTGQLRRHHLHETVIQRAVKVAVREVV